MHPSATMPPVGPSPHGPTGTNVPPGTVRMSSRYVDAAGRFHTVRASVPVNENGQITGKGWTCPKCHETRWLGIKHVGTPVCPRCNRKMREAALRGAPLLPWSAIWRAVDAPLRAVWVGAGIGVAGVGMYEAAVPGWALAAAAAPVGYGVRFAAQRYWLAEQVQRGNIDPTDSTSGLRHRRRVARRARAVGVTAAVATAWTGVAAWLGTDPGTAAGAVSWLTLVGLWTAPAATWWRHLRDQRSRPDAPAVMLDDGPMPPPEDPDEAHTRRIWTSIVAARKDQVIGKRADGTEIRARRDGKLADTRIEDWRRVTGGCAFTAVGPDGDYLADNYLGAVGAVAAAFRMKRSMVTCVPDPEDENRALYLLQRTPPIAEVVRWAGPDSIDVERGVAPIAMYADGTPVMYELWRPGWGTPHGALFGTTGSGKSYTVKNIMGVHRWAHWRERGLVADFLVDPQQGQSYSEFTDDLAAPIARSLPEALMLVRALTAEGLRRNRYLATVQWPDPKRKNRDGSPKMRRGRSWWNPLVDGPVLVLIIDEAHDYLSNREFVTLVTKAGRMWRKCGMKVLVATHTPLLQDLGGNMALRDMLTGGFVWVGRTANSLSAPTAFNGRLPADPRTIPETPGMAYVMTGSQPKAMLARSAFEPDWYDWIRDDDDEPIGYPAQLPPETLEAFGPEYATWVAAMRSGGEWTPGNSAVSAAAEPTSGMTAVDAVFSALAASAEPLDMDELDGRLRSVGVTYSTRTVRDGLKQLRDAGRVFSAKGRHELTPQAREEIQEQTDEAAEVAE